MFIYKQKTKQQNKIAESSFALPANITIQLSPNTWQMTMQSFIMSKFTSMLCNHFFPDANFNNIMHIVRAQAVTLWNSVRMVKLGWDIMKTKIVFFLSRFFYSWYLRSGSTDFPTLFEHQLYLYIFLKYGQLSTPGKG